MKQDKEVLPPQPEGMSDELYEQYISWYNNPKRYESLYPIIYKQFLKPFIDKENLHGKDQKRPSK